MDKISIKWAVDDLGQIRWYKETGTFHELLERLECRSPGDGSVGIQYASSEIEVTWPPSDLKQYLEMRSKFDVEGAETSIRVLMVKTADGWDYLLRDRHGELIDEFTRVGDDD